MAGIALSSLRVTSDLDVSGYVRGAAQKVAADQQMIAADKARNASLAQADAAMAKVVPGMASVSKALLDGYGAGAQFEAQIRRIGNAADRGMGIDRINLLLDAAYRKFGLTADATVLAERGFVSISGAVSNLNTHYEQLSLSAASAAAAVARASTQAGINQSFGIGAVPGKSAQESADAFLAQYGGLEGVAKAKAQEAGAAFSADLDSRMVAGAAKSARDAANVFDLELKRVETIAQQRAEQAGANFQRSLTESLGGGGAPATSQGATYSALAEQVKRLDEIEQARAAHNAQVTQQAVAAAYGLDRQAKSAKDSAEAFLAAALAEEQMAAKAAALRAAINPLETEMVRLGKEMAEYRALLDAGRISSVEFERAQVMAAKRLSDVDLNMRQAATGGRVLSGELGNLGYQVNDVLTGLALGQPIFMIAAQQGGQIYQIFAHSKASIGDFASAYGSWMLGLVTPTRAAFTVIAASVGLGTAALITYEGRIQEVQRLLTGMGRASGATATGIDAIAQANSSPTGLSTNEARNLAAALAATGKVGVDSIGPIVALGHDFAKTFGIDAKTANELLAKSFADPARGAEELNQRLGFLDANTKLLIESLVIQGNRTEAVRILTEKIKGSIADAADITSFWGRAWTVTSNSMSDFFDRIGRGADRVFAGGSGLDEKITNLTVKLLELEKARLTGNPLDSIFQNVFPSDMPAKIAAVTAEIERLNAIRRKQSATPSPETRDKQRALEIDAIARAMLPTIDATRKLDDETKALNEALSNPAISKWVSIVGDDLVRALGRVEAARNAMRGADPITNQIADTAAQIAALDQRSIADRARLAREAEYRRQSLDPGAGTAAERLTKQNQAALLAAGGQTALDNVERQRIATLGGMASIEEVVKNKQLELNNLAREGVVISLAQQKAMRDLAREQALGVTAMKQQADTTRIQAETLGMSVGKAAEYTAVQTRLADALRNKQVLTAKDIEQIKAQAKVLGNVTQASALAAANENIRFGRQTAILSPEDVQIAQQLRGIYPDVATALASVQAAGLRTNATLSGLSSSISGTLTTGLADVFDGTKTVSAGFRDMSKTIVRAVEEAIIKIMIVGPLMRSLQGAASGLGIFNFGSAAAAVGTAGSPFFGPIAPSARGNAFYGGNVIPFAYGGIVNRPTMFPMARGMGLMGEAGAEAVMPLRRGPDGRLGVAASGAGSRAGDISIGGPTIIVQGNADDKALREMDRRLTQHENVIRGIMKQASSSQRYQSTGVL
jgi:hypothetical protein